ncbi:MAG: aminoglycoside phosphotransferase family protein [Christensenellaceae bacterium]|jgi:aminoglycoside phosphotransferase (APT) family kinase protein|nr:aminoglycoside phosphotransferase family protein [Christensenellaceae bacterium]
MRSKTKYKINTEKLKELFMTVGIDNVIDIKPLDSGEFNAVFSVKTDKKEFVIKIAPDDRAPTLAYEKGMLKAELQWYSLIQEHTDIKVPEIYYSDFSRRLIPTDYFIMEKIEGQQLNKIKLSSDEKMEITMRLPEIAQKLHTIKNNEFGYLQRLLHNDWYQAIRDMTMSLDLDARTKRKRCRYAEKLLFYIEKHKEILKKAECCMVNFDLNEANFICSRIGDSLALSLIDPERSFWGDFIADFVCIEMMNPLNKKTVSLRAYNSVSNSKIEINREIEIRYAVALCYLGVLMDVEKHFRYSPLNFGWWRNLIASKSLVATAIRSLKK